MQRTSRSGGEVVVVVVVVEYYSSMYQGPQSGHGRYFEILEIPCNRGGEILLWPRLQW